ncbi:MAG: tetratricopeptide repeat protein [Devosia sp.]
MPPKFDDLYRAAIQLHQSGRAVAAGRAYDELLKMRPGHYGALHLKGVLALQKHDYATAVEFIGKSLKAQPRHDIALSNYGIALRALERHAEAIDALEQAVALSPNSAEFWTNLSQTQLEAGMTREGVASSRRAIALAPERLGPRVSMIFGTNYLAEADPQLLKADAVEYAELVRRQVRARTHHDNDRDPERTLCVGLVSGDFKTHPVGRFLVALLSNIDRQKVAFVGYSDSRRSDELTETIKAGCTDWRETLDVSDADVARLMVEDRIDIAVDLSGYTGSRRLAAFAEKPAPVAFTWLGYFATTGFPEIDYVLANRWVVPEAEEPQWVEKPWRLPDTYLCFTAPPDAPQPGPLPALSTGQLTFGCFNSFDKISERTLAAWGALMAQVPNSRLILRSSGIDRDQKVRTLESSLVAHGIDLARVRVDPRIYGYAAHLKSYDEIDIALDPFPYNGGTTTVEALYMGVPVLVRAGDRYVAHMGESILHNAGLADWIAPDEVAYAGLGAAKAADLEALAVLRAGMRARMLASPLFDGPRFARNFEDAMRGMWRLWCATQGRG